MVPVCGYAETSCAVVRFALLSRCYAINTVVLVSFMQWVRTWPAARGLHGAWMGLFLLQTIRFVFVDKGIVTCVSLPDLTRVWRTAEGRCRTQSLGTVLKVCDIILSHAHTSL